MGQSFSVGVLLLATAAIAGCGPGGVNGDVTATQDGGNTVNGSILVPAGLHSGTVDTVNGSIHIEDNAVVRTAATVNGGINMGAHSSATSLTTVNGEVALGESARVEKGVTTVNGSLVLKNGAEVGGRLRNVNGHIVLTGARVGGGLQTVGGDIDVTGGSHVEGGILVEKSTSWFNFNPSTKPRIVIGPGSVVQGDLRFEREVNLYVSDQATIGPVTGATVVRFSGDKPPG